MKLRSHSGWGNVSFVLATSTSYGDILYKDNGKVQYVLEYYILYVNNVYI